MSSAPSTPRPPRRIVPCPTCGGDSVYAPENPFRPFCSERCKNVDLGAWASESYRVAAPPQRPEGDDTATPPIWPPTGTENDDNSRQGS